MKSLFNFILLVLLFSNTATEATVTTNRNGFSYVEEKEIQEEDVTFSYSSSDGSFQLKCTHVFDKPELNDWDVWCGKGTPHLRQFRVHFLARHYKNQETKQSAFEVLYWVHDRNQPTTKSFSSTSSWIELKNMSTIASLSFSQGLENDYAFLKLDFKPKN